MSACRALSLVWALNLAGGMALPAAGPAGGAPPDKLPAAIAPPFRRVCSPQYWWSHVLQRVAVTVQIPAPGVVFCHDGTA